MKMISKVGSISMSACLLIIGVNACAIARVICSQPTAITATCDQLKYKYHTTSGTANDFSQILEPLFTRWYFELSSQFSDTRTHH